MKTGLGFIATLLLSMGLALNVHAAFPEEDVTIVIPYSPGGGFDTTVRAFAPHFADHLGSDISVLPRNMPGAGGRRGTTMVYRADPDGYTLGIINLPGFALPRILGEPAEYDLREMSWIGRIEAQNYVLLTSGSSDIESIEDLKNQDKITFTSTGYGSTILATTQIVSSALGLQQKDPIFLAGYSGTSDSLVGLVRGDGNAALAPISSASKYVESGDLRALAVSGDTSPFEGVPTFAEAGYPELTPLSLQRALAGPADLDQQVLDKLREAFTETVNDPAFKDAAEKARMDVSPLSGEEAAKEVQDSFDFYEKFKTDLSNPNAQ